MTDAGREIAKIIVEKVDEILDFVGDCLDDSERASLYTSLEQISNRLDDYYEKI